MTATTPLPRSVDDLTPAHRHQLEIDSAIPSWLLAEEGIRSYASSAKLPPPSPELRHPDSEKGRRFASWRKNLGSGIYFPNGDLSGQYKPDTARVTTSTDTRTGVVKRRTVKYETPSGTRPALFIPTRVRAVLGNITVPLLLTEGVKKALAAVGCGVMAISLAGVDGWAMNVDGCSLPIPDWDLIDLDGRLILIGYDSDAVDNRNVRAAEQRLAAFLRERGAVVVILRLPPVADGAKQGIDDLIAAGGNLPVLVHAAIVAAISRGQERASVGGDGAETCQHCVERGREQRLREQFTRHGPFTPNLAAVITVLVTTAIATRANGRATVALDRTDLAALSNVSTAEVTRAFKAYQRYQNDPACVDALPFTLASRKDARGHDHVDLHLTDATPLVPADAYLTMSRWPNERAPRGGNQREASSRTRSLCDCGGLLLSSQKVCRDCGTVHNFPIPFIRAASEPSCQPVTPTVEDPVTIDGARFDLLVRPAEKPGDTLSPGFSPEETFSSGPPVPMGDKPSSGSVLPVTFGLADDVLDAASPHRLALLDDLDDPPTDPEAPATILGCIRTGCTATTANGFACVDHLVGADAAADLIDPPEAQPSIPTPRPSPASTIPGWQPPPLAPASHRARGFEQHRPPLAAPGGLA